jgi:HSP20 family protein
MNTLLPVTRMLDALAANLDACNYDACNLDATNPAETGVWLSPRADILEGEKDYRILMDLPGVAAKDLEISHENQTLTVKARRGSSVGEGYALRRHERPGPVSFSRSFTLGQSVDADGITASFADGVLTLVMPKSQRSLPRRIEVR